MHFPVRAILISIALVLFSSVSSWSIAAGEPVVVEPVVAAAATVPPVFFHEAWKQPPESGERPVSQEAVSSRNLVLGLYGAGAKDIQLSGDDSTPARPLNFWTGLASTPFAVTLKDKNSYADLSGLAKISWVTRVSGFHQVRPVIKLADGNWYVGDLSSGNWTTFDRSEISFANVRWISLDIEHVYTRGVWVEGLDLSKVDEIGFADLMPGSGHGAGGWMNVGDITLYANAVKR